MTAAVFFCFNVLCLSNLFLTTVVYYAEEEEEGGGGVSTCAKVPPFPLSSFQLPLSLFQRDGEAVEDRGYRFACLLTFFTPGFFLVRARENSMAGSAVSDSCFDVPGFRFHVMAPFFAACLSPSPLVILLTP